MSFGFMDKNAIKMLFDNGVVQAAEIIESPTKPMHWNIQFRLRNGSIEILEDSRGKGAKIYSKLDTAARAVNLIGFKSVSISMPTHMGQAIPKPEDFNLG